MRKIILIFFICAAVNGNTVYNSFNSGELSPLMKYRLDLDKRQMGLETLENFIIKPQGAAVRRPGTKYIAQTRNNERVRLIPFEYAATDTYMMEFGDEYIRFYRKDPNAGESGQILTLVAPEVFTGPPDISGDLLAYWMLNDDADNNDVVDQGGNYDGIATINTDELHKSGVGGYGSFFLDRTYAVEIDDNANFTFAENTKPFSIIGWAYVKNTDDIQTVISKWDEGIGKEWRLQLLSDETLRFELYDNSLGLGVNCVSQWKLNENAASTTVVDTQGTQNGVATANTSVLHTTGKIDGAFDFDTQYAVEIDDNASYSFGNASTDVAFSAAFWMKVDSYTYGDVLLSKWDTANKREWFISRQNFVLNVYYLNLHLYDESVDKYINAYRIVYIPLNVWHFVVITYDGSETYEGVNVYFDGVSAGPTMGEKQAGYIAMENLSSKVAIGASYASGVLDDFYNGNIDNVMIFNKELSASEVEGLYASGSGTEDLVGDSVYATTDDSLPEGWNYIAATYDSTGGVTAASGIKLYIDGEEADSTAHNYASYVKMENTDADVRIGSQLSSASEQQYIWSNKLDNIAIFDAELSDDEVLSLYDTEVYEVNSPYSLSHLRQLKYAQQNDVMYILHPDVSPQKLSRYDHTDWTIEDVNWIWGPFLNDNTEDTTITASDVNGTISLYASENIFYPEHEGALWKITEKQDPTYVTESIDDDPTFTDSLQIQGDYLLTINGTYEALVTLEKSDDDGETWIPVYPKLSTGDAVNTEYSGSEPDSGWEYRVTMSDRTSGSAKVKLIAYENFIDGYVRIDTYVDPNEVVATVLSELAASEPTKKWAEGAFSDKRGWPRGICFNQNRLCLAGTSYMPNGFWASKSGGDYENMLAGSDDDDAIVYEVSSAKQNPILWIEDKQGIIAGTAGSTINIYSAGTNATLTWETITSEVQNQGASCDIQASLVDDAIIYIGRGRRKVREMVYDLASESFLSPDLTIWAEHITDPCIVETAVQSRPDSTYWCVRGDGELPGLTYNRTESIAGWHRQITDGNFVSVGVLPTNTEDEIWLCVNRYIDGNNNYYIEQVQPQNWDDDPNNCWFLDCALEYDGAETDTIKGLSYLEGKTVQIFYDANSFQTADVNGGEISVDPNVTYAVVGLPFTSTLQTFPIELTTQSGVSLGYKKKIYQLISCFKDTMYGQYGIVGQFTDPTMWDIPFSSWPTVALGSDLPYTGQIRLSVDSGWDDETSVKFIQEEPYPFNLTALAIKLEVSED